MNWPGIVPPKTSSTNSKPLPRSSGSTAQIDLAELPRAAGLFLVAVMAFGVGLDRFAIGDLRRLGVDVQAAILQLLQHQPQMQLADAVDDDLVRLAIGVPFEGRDLPRRFWSAASEIFCSSPRALGVIARPYIGVGKVSGLRCTLSSA